MKFIKTDISPNIKKFRTKLYQKFVAPLDAMWELLYIASSQHYLIENEGASIGYCCINDKATLLEIHLNDENINLMSVVIKELINGELIASASLSSIEALAFNTCLLHSKSIKANTFCYQYHTGTSVLPTPLKIEQATIMDLKMIKDFLLHQIGFDDNFGYTENLINRKELFMIKEKGTIIASSEYRLSETQKGVVDLGVIVHKEQQGKGLAPKILQQQAQLALKANQKPICSTTYDNIASQKAISKAGFFCSHIILDINFTDQ